MPTGWTSVCSNRAFHLPRSTRFLATRNTRLGHPLGHPQPVVAVYVDDKLVTTNIVCSWLGRQGSNLGMSVPKTDALPLGDAPTEAVFSRCILEPQGGGA